MNTLAQDIHTVLRAGLLDLAINALYIGLSLGLLMFMVCSIIKLK